MFCKIDSLGLMGIEPYIVSIEVDSRKGLPNFDIVGLPDVTIKESRERVRSAIQSMGYPAPDGKLVANFAPADTKKLGSVYDLPLLLAVVCACGYESLDFSGAAVIGEIGLSGEIRGLCGVLPMVLDAKRLGFTRVIVPMQNAGEASVASGVDVFAAEHVEQVVDYFKGTGSLPLAKKVSTTPISTGYTPDLADVKGQSEGKRAMEVAAAGGHNLILIGPPGTGKSMLAKRFPSILPPMTQEEAIEVTKIYSVSGELASGESLLTQRPFRSPHHSVSTAALVGGGSNSRPGEISLAHNGVLFLDEIPEFSKASLEVLRQPLEDGKVCISRVRQRLTYPSRVMLVGAMNPCPCGFFGHPTKPCTCSSNVMQRYISKISGPMLDRIDLHIEVLPIDFAQINDKGQGESSTEIRKRVVAARDIQVKRFVGTGVTCNADMTANMTQQFCQMDSSATTLLKAAFDRLGLSARGYHRILKMARTIADLASCETISSTHVSQAIQFRSLDRKYFGS